ncbi:hypothetical protein BKA83DRAFT_74666, partial [Pisolithus microcarpus]
LVGELPTLSKLTTVLHLVTQLPHVPASAIDSIRAIAYLLDHVETTSFNVEFQNTVFPSLSETVANHVIASISLHIASLQDSVNSLHKHLTSHPPVTSQVHAPPQPLPQPTHLYSNAAKTPPHSHLAAAALAKAEMHTRQVLFTPTLAQTLYTKNTDPISIAASISDLLITLIDEDSPYANIKSAVCLNNSNLLLELNSEEAAQWVRTPPIKEALSTTLGIDTMVKVHTFAIMAPFFPVSHDLTDPTFLSEIELENDIPPHSLHSAQWV